MADSPTLDNLDDDAGPDLRADASQPVAACKPELPLRASTVDIENLYRSHFAKVCRYFKRCGESEALALELAQDTFIQALRACAQFDGRSQLSTWLWAIARNTLLGHLRKQGRRVAGDGAPGARVVDPDSLTSAHSGRQMERDACVRRGFAAFAQAHPERAQVIYLAAVEGWTREELAAHLGRTAHAATEYLSQCRAKLKPYIEGCDGEC